MHKSVGTHPVWFVSTTLTSVHPVCVCETVSHTLPPRTHTSPFFELPKKSHVTMQRFPHTPPPTHTLPSAPHTPAERMGDLGVERQIDSGVCAGVCASVCAAVSHLV
eukprot:GDKI01014510.1.p1 GENE.GDKI01014510.1~~GDKI01014510.1.p1  ORF type:complete len:107 (+),score=37.68 GDKI01014510.1:238-558(+)